MSPVSVCWYNMLLNLRKTVLLYAGPYRGGAANRVFSAEDVAPKHCSSQQALRSEAGPVHICHLLFVSSRAWEGDRRFLDSAVREGRLFVNLFLPCSRAWHLVSLATAHGFANLCPGKLSYSASTSTYCSMKQNVYKALGKLSRSLLRPHLLSSGARGSRTNRYKHVRSTFHARHDLSAEMLHVAKMLRGACSGKCSVFVLCVNIYYIYKGMHTRSCWWATCYCCWSRGWMLVSCYLCLVAVNVSGGPELQIKLLWARRTG